MRPVKVIILARSPLLYFFFKETLYDEGLVDHADSVRQADQVIDLICTSGPYELLVIDWIHSGHEEAQLISWLNQQPNCCPIIRIVPPTLSRPDPLKHPVIPLFAPVSLQDLTTNARTILTKVNRLNKL